MGRRGDGYGFLMRLGLFGLHSGSAFGATETRDLAQLAEGLGFDSIWAGEHVVLPSPRAAPSPMEPDDPILDPLIHLAYIAAVTDAVLLGTGVVILPQRNPLVLAKQATSLDVLSEGRLLLGVGAGYLEPEMRAIGVPMRDRGRRTDEYIEAMRTLWSAPGPVAFHGTYVDFSGIDAHPRPVTAGGPRIVVGGHSPAAYRRAVAYGSGWYGFGLTPEDARRCLEGLDAAAATTSRPQELGRLEVSVTPGDRLDAATLAGFASAGVDRVIVNTSRESDPRAVELQLREAIALVS